MSASSTAFCQCEKGRLKFGKLKRGKRTKSMVLANGLGAPLGLHAVRAALATCRIEPIIPAQATYRQATHQDGRRLRRYRCRRIAERTDAWL